MSLYFVFSKKLDEFELFSTKVLLIIMFSSPFLHFSRFF